MKIVFLSNYYNRHQHPLSQALFRLCGGEYTFIATSEMREERRAMGYELDAYPDYVLRYYENEETAARCRKLILDADVLLVGSAPENLLKERCRANKLILRYAERPLRRGKEPFKYLPRLVRWHLRNPQHRPYYLLCAGAYTFSDYRRFFLYKDRAFRWGYFPGVAEEQNEDALFSNKQKNKLLFCARLLPLKHPEHALETARRLKERGIEFTLDFLGDGEMRDVLEEEIARLNLSDCVHLCGNLKQEDVVEKMKEAGVFLLCSDAREGWGAVVNEAMGAGCAVVASDAAGSVPYLIYDRENGIRYPSGNTDALTDEVADLLTHPEKQEVYGRAARKTVTGLWSAEVAAVRLIALCEALLNEPARAHTLFADGPLSPAPLYKEKTF